MAGDLTNYGNLNVVTGSTVKGDVVAGDRLPAGKGRRVVGRGRSGSVFVNYRRGPGNGSVAAIRRALADLLGPDRVFFDVRSMDGGERYPDALRVGLARCRVLLAVIGDGWLDELRRRHRAGIPDWSRHEIGTALRDSKVVLPVLLDDAQLPVGTDLPPDIADLAHRQAVRVQWRQQDEDLAALCASVRRHLT